MESHLVHIAICSDGHDPPPPTKPPTRPTHGPSQNRPPPPPHTAKGLSATG